MMNKDTTWAPSRRALLTAVAGMAAASEPLVSNAARAREIAMQASDETAARPTVRAITGFITLDVRTYEKQLGDAAAFLLDMKDIIVAQGYDVSTIRIVTQPFPEYTRKLNDRLALELLGRIGQIAEQKGVTLSIGPVCSPDNQSEGAITRLVELLQRPGNRVNANIIVADGSGICWPLVETAGRIVERLGASELTPQANFNFAALAMHGPFGPFFPGAWHWGGPKNSFSIGLQSANVVSEVLARRPALDVAAARLTRALTAPAMAIEKLAMQRAGDWLYAGIDPTPAPMGRVSIGAAIESMTGAPFGSPGTETVCAIITAAVKAVDVRHVGYSGIMLPVLEDDVLARRWTEGRFGTDSILSYSAVCAGGLDTVPLPGATPAKVLARMIGDVATLAFKWNKPLAARLLPAFGRRAGELTKFGGLLGEARIQPVAGEPRLVGRGCRDPRGAAPANPGPPWSSGCA